MKHETQKKRHFFLFKNFYFLIVVFIFLFLSFGFCRAAVLYFEPLGGEYRVGDTFLVEVRIDTQGECINAIEADLEFSQNALKAIDFSTGNSLITFWVKSPNINQELGLISWSGGIPGGYCGLVLGEPDRSGLLGRIAFKAQEDSGESSAVIKFLNSSKVLLNDGLGTEAELTVQNSNFSFFSEGSGSIRDEWQEQIEEDAILPEIFEVEINQDSSIFDGKQFAVFATTDKQTGIDYYEIKEGRGDWQQAISPYLLNNQNLKGIIKVKAVDKAGNERIVEYVPEFVKRLLFYRAIVFIIVGAGMIIFVWWYKNFALGTQGA